jgi:hypothetical protein
LFPTAALKNPGKDNTFTVVEANVHLEVGPGELIAADLERDTLGLGEISVLSPTLTQKRFSASTFAT